MTSQAPSSEPPRAPSVLVRRFGWLVPLFVAVVEVIGHFTVQARVPEPSDWQSAAAFVRSELRAKDQVLAAPAWSDPLLRQALGDRITFAMTGASDLDPFERLWVVSIRGRRAPLAPLRSPDWARQFGRVRVEMWRLGRSPVLFDLTESVASAEVTYVVDGVERPCPRTVARRQGGGLGGGPVWPSERFACEPRRPWLWVAPTINEDLSLHLRRCVWQHPSGPEPVRVTYRNVPLGTRLVLYSDVYSEYERMQEHGPYQVRVLVDGHDVGSMRHIDGDGWKRMEALTQSIGANPERRGSITIETTAPDPSMRTVCWSATVQGPRREVGP